MRPAPALFAAALSLLPCAAIAQSGIATNTSFASAVNIFSLPQGYPVGYDAATYNRALYAGQANANTTYYFSFQVLSPGSVLAGLDPGQVNPVTPTNVSFYDAGENVIVPIDFQGLQREVLNTPGTYFVSFTTGDLPPIGAYPPPGNPYPNNFLFEIDGTIDDPDFDVPRPQPSAVLGAVPQGSAVPEPGSAGLVAAGMGLLLIKGRRRRFISERR